MVELYDYTESESEFVLLMEYCNDANYFQDKIEDVRQLIYVLIIKRLTPIMNQGKLQSFAFDILNGLDFIHS